MPIPDSNQLGQLPSDFLSWEAIFLALGTWPMISIGDSPSGGGEARGIPRVAKGQGRG